MSLKNRVAATAALVIASALGATAAHAEPIVALTGLSIYQFDSATPGTGTTVSLGSLDSGYSARAIDFRPSNGKVYLFATNSTSYRLYTVNLTSGAVTAVGNAVNTSNAYVSNGFAINTSIDVDPVNDVLRVVDNSSRRKNFRVNLNTGALVGIDADFSTATSLVDYAFDNTNTTTPTAYAISATTITQFTASITNPNSATYSSIASDPIDQTQNDYITGNVGFDISGFTGTGYVSYNKSGTGYYLGIFNPSTGLITESGSFGSNSIVDITVIPEPSALGLLALPAAALTRRRRA
jgi:hypothetical protein